MVFPQQSILSPNVAESVRSSSRPVLLLRPCCTGVQPFSRPQRRWLLRSLSSRSRAAASGNALSSSGGVNGSSGRTPQRTHVSKSTSLSNDTTSSASDSALQLQQSWSNLVLPISRQPPKAATASSEVVDAASAVAASHYKALQQQQQQEQELQQQQQWGQPQQCGLQQQLQQDWGTLEQIGQQWRERSRQHAFVGARPAIYVPAAPCPSPPFPSASSSPLGLNSFLAGAVAAVLVHYIIRFVATLPVMRYFVHQFIWWKDPAPHGARERTSGGSGAPLLPPGIMGSEVNPGSSGKALMQYSDDGESVEWVNMCGRKVWRLYQQSFAQSLADRLQPLFDLLVAQHTVPRFVQRLRILEFSLDHEAPYFTNMQRRTSRKDSDLTGVVDIRYTGGARMVLLIEVGLGRWRIKIPVLVSDLDLECKMWLKIQLAPMAPYIGTLSLAFAGPPNIKIQLSPYDKVRLMRIPVLQAFLTRFFAVDLPGLMVLPKRLEVNIPPAVTAVAEAAVGRDALMRAVASAVLQADALEHALLAALPLGPQSAAGGVSLPESFRGELSVTLHEARELPVWGFPWQSNPYCRLALGNQAVQSRRDVDTSRAGRHREPVWNQEFQFLVEDPTMQTLEIWVRDSTLTGRREVGYASFPLSSLAEEGILDIWLPVESSLSGKHVGGMVHLSLNYKSFSDDDADSGRREAQAPAKHLGEHAQAIVDVKSAADASARAAVAASTAATAVAMTRAAAARAATRLARSASGASASSSVDIMSSMSDDDDDVRKYSEGVGRGESLLIGASTSRCSEGTCSGGSPVEVAAVAAAPSTNLGTLAKSITDTLQQATLEQEHLANLSMGDAEKQGDGGLGTGANTVIDSEGITTGASVGSHPVEPLPVSLLEEITAAMHDMKLEVDQLLYSPRQHGDIAPEGHSMKSSASSAGTHAEVAGAAADMAESAAVVEGIAIATAGTAAAEAQQGDAESASSNLAVTEQGSSSSVTELAEPVVSTSASLEQRGLAMSALAGRKNKRSNWRQQASCWVRKGLAKLGVERREEVEVELLGDDADEDHGKAEGSPVRDVIIPADFPLDAIAEEVQKSWKAKEVHVEALIRKAMEARRKQSEHSWLVILTLASGTSAVLLSMVLYHMMQMP